MIAAMLSEPMASLLVVDDDPTIRLMFSRALASLGDIEEASGGIEALRLLGSKRYDVVLMDLHMPGVDGFAVLQALATKPGPNRDTPVYVITADTSEQARASALRRALFFLTKPVQISMLVTLIGAALQKRAAKPAAKKSVS
jgi:CheY-like chemotaxis protein